MLFVVVGFLFVSCFVVRIQLSILERNSHRLRITIKADLSLFPKCFHPIAFDAMFARSFSVAVSALLVALHSSLSMVIGQIIFVRCICTLHRFFLWPCQINLKRQKRKVAPQLNAVLLAFDSTSQMQSPMYCRKICNNNVS